MSSIYFGKMRGFGKRNKKRGTVMERRAKRRAMVTAIVKKLKAEGKPIDRQAINKDVLKVCGRQRQNKKPKSA